MKKEEIEHEELWIAGIIDSVLSRSNNNTDKFIINLKKVGYKVVKIESENERLKSEREYWKERCLLAEDCLEKSPCDPDITSEQIEAWGTYHRFIKEFGVLPPKQ